METLRELIETAVADYGFRLAVMWGPDDVIAMSSLTDEEASVLKHDLLPEFKALPDPRGTCRPTERQQATGRTRG